MPDQPNHQPCPLCNKPLERAYEGVLSCYTCWVNVDEVTGEIAHMRKQKGIIKNITDKLKSFLWL